jgi:hypothetical protein
MEGNVARIRRSAAIPGWAADELQAADLIPWLAKGPLQESGCRIAVRPKSIEMVHETYIFMSLSSQQPNRLNFGIGPVPDLPATVTIPSERRARPPVGRSTVPPRGKCGGFPVLATAP